MDIHPTSLPLSFQCSHYLFFISPFNILAANLAWLLFRPSIFNIESKTYIH